MEVFMEHLRDTTHLAETYHDFQKLHLSTFGSGSSIDFSKLKDSHRAYLSDVIVRRRVLPQFKSVGVTSISAARSMITLEAHRARSK